MTTRKPTSLVTRIMIGLAAGIIVGILLNPFPEHKIWFIDNLLQPAGDLFIAQAYGIDLGLADQAMLVLIMVLTSKGAAGVPGFMFIILTATLTAAGLPVEGVAIIAGVYRLMDMPVTALNVLGNALAPLVIARWEGQLKAPESEPATESVSPPFKA